MSFSKILDIVIVGSPLASNDHCYVLLIVPDHFELRILYVHTLFSKSSDQKFNHQIYLFGQNYLVEPDDPDLCRIIRAKPFASSRMIRPLPGSFGSQCPEPSAQVRMIRLLPGSSGPGSSTIKRPRRGSAQTLFIFSATTHFAPQLACAAIWIFNQGFVKLSCAFDSPRLGTSGPLRNSSICAGNLKVLFTQNPLAPIYQCRKF